MNYLMHPISDFPSGDPGVESKIGGMTEKKSTQQIIAAVRWSEEPQPFEYLIESGLLHHLNKTALRRFGFVLEVELDAAGAATGFRLIGDGTQRTVPASIERPMNGSTPAIISTLAPKRRDPAEVD